MSDEGWASAEAKRPCVEIDLAGAILNQSAVDMLIEMLKNSFAEPYNLVDIRILKVSRLAIPNLKVNYPDCTPEDE